MSLPHKLTPAFAVANATILKPAPQTPLTSRLRAEVLHEAGLRQEVLSVIHCDTLFAAFPMEKWADTTAARIYIAHDIHPLIETELAPRGVHRHGPSLHYNRPQIVGLE